MSLNKKYLVCGNGFNWESDDLAEATAKYIADGGLIYERSEPGMDRRILESARVLLSVDPDADIIEPLNRLIAENDDLRGALIEWKQAAGKAIAAHSEECLRSARLLDENKTLRTASLSQPCSPDAGPHADPQRERDGE